jgi:hypothetical protein
VQGLLIPGFEIMTISDFSLFIFSTSVILSKESKEICICLKRVMIQP